VRGTSLSATVADDLASRAAAVDAVLGRLPPRSRWTDEEARSANAAIAECRALRASLAARYGGEIYDRLTHDRTEAVALGDLMERAAVAIPGLAPTAEQMREERARLQRDKLGREIDQAILLREWLRLPDAGLHLVRVMRAPTERARTLLPRFQADGFLDLGLVRLHRQGVAGYVVLENHRSLNAEDETTLDDLETAVDLVLLDESIRVGVLRGGVMTHPAYAGRRVFSAGINLRQLHDGQIGFLDFLVRRELGCLSKILRGLTTSNGGSNEKPWVAAVDAFAIGGGMQIVLTCDWVVAERDAYFWLPAADEGIVPGVANLRLGRYVGHRWARSVILGGEKIAANADVAPLICHEVTDVGSLEQAIDRAVTLLSVPAVVANRRLLNLADETEDAFRVYMAEFAYEQAQRLYSDDLLENLRRWSGGAGDDSQATRSSPP
jgi:thioesterase DpgC